MSMNRNKIFLHTEVETNEIIFDFKFKYNGFDYYFFIYNDF